MKPKFPARPEQFKMRCNRIVEHCQNPALVCMMRIPPIAKMECQMVVEAYYGGKFRACWYQFKEAVWLKAHDVRWSVLLWVTDTVGWTVVHKMPETETHHSYMHRHGRRCHGSPNCNNRHCIEDSLPRWFKWLTRWEKFTL